MLMPREGSQRAIKAEASLFESFQIGHTLESF
jgi:hypothetical protein